MKNKFLKSTCAAIGAFVGLGLSSANAGDLSIESWRVDDLAIWQNQIIPAFEKSHPGIKLKFSPTAPTEYNAALNSRLAAGSAGDLITCRPFDASLTLYQQGHLVKINGLPGLKNFGPAGKSAWTTDDGSEIFCMPMASVLHGFIYNKEAFDELGLSEPKTVDEFFALLDKIKEDGSYIPLAMGTNDQWETASMGYDNIGPNYWKGEEGRAALIRGEQKLTDPGWVGPFEQLARWGDYLGAGYQAQTYPDSQNLFTLGRAAIYPAGSWEISGFNEQADFAMGAFAPPVQNAGDECYISDHVDIGIGINPKTENIDDAIAFLNWVGSKEFAEIFANALPGFFPLSKHQITLQDSLANEFISWRQSCQSAIRHAYQIFTRGKPDLETETWNAAVNVIKGTETPEAASQRLQEGLAGWYKPQQ